MTLKNLVLTFGQTLLLMIVVFGLVSVALAADDLLDEAELLDAPEIFTEDPTGWYLRGDLSFLLNQPNSPTFSTSWRSRIQSPESDLDDNLGVGIGVGYQFNEYFRAEVMGSYHTHADFKSSTTVDCRVGGSSTSRCNWQISSNLTSLQVMANLYADLGNFMGFSPYIGAGLGSVHMSWDDVNSASRCVQGRCGGVNAKVEKSSAAPVSGEVSWRLVWALHAGVSYDVAERTKVDLGYSFARSQGGKMFSGGRMENSVIRGSGIDAHMFRIGLRYSF